MVVEVSMAVAGTIMGMDEVSERKRFRKKISYCKWLVFFLLLILSQ